MPTNLTPREAKKQFEAKVKAERAAEKARKKDSTDPNDMGRVRQVWEAIKITTEYDKPLPYLLVGSVVVPLILGIVIPLVIWHTAFPVVYGGILGLLLGMVLAMLLLARRAKQATYKRYADQAGSAEVALRMLPKEWSNTPAITANKSMDVIHRAIGPGGLVLVGEGDPGRVRAMLASEAKKHQRVNDRMKITTLVMGKNQGQVPLEKLADVIRKLPKSMSVTDINEAKSRFAALDAVRPRIPLPKGPIPTSPRQARGSRQALRGR